DVDRPAGIDIKPRHNVPIGVHGRRDAVVCGTHQREPLLHGPHARLVQMLAWTGGVAEPAVVGDVEQQPRSLAALHYSRGKDGLVTDERAGKGKVGDVEKRAWAGADAEAAAQARQLPKSDRLQQRLQGQVLAEGHKMGLVVAGNERTLFTEDQDAVE